ncbi:hypothetical protein CWI36_0059p0030 [Hamiltosporidium magnivora]|uniref:Phospholipid/glycerol acyltransferase domain-containing protein n=1 Tax=Hamiltosporidium magnivora TaxID=148818 RepID=A0A4Q9LNN3_9MICR|nr:hypothetical protein CWI36_0059p0030 [Hamiltosporidium magnivora]
MERYSNFRDPFTGINPFLNPKRKSLRFFDYIIAVLKIPLLLFLPFFIDYFIKIKKKSEWKGEKCNVVCNNVSFLDKIILKKIFKNVDFLYYNDDIYRKSSKLVKVIFPEECRSNGKALLRMKEVKCDYVCGLRYNDESVFLYGNFLYFILQFLASKNHVEIDIMKSVSSKDLAKATGLLPIDMGKKEFDNFLKILKNEK